MDVAVLLGFLGVDSDVVGLGFTFRWIFSGRCKGVSAVETVVLSTAVYSGSLATSEGFTKLNGAASTIRGAYLLVPDATSVLGSGQRTFDIASGELAGVSGGTNRFHGFVTATFVVLRDAGVIGASETIVAIPGTGHT